jgi:DNA polymerase-3 subunit delta'
MLFKNVPVDETLKRQLANLVKKNRISHAQLFLGKAGYHVFALAVAYAQYVSCARRGEWDSCGECPSCKKFEKLEHPDLHLIFPNTTSKEVKKDPDSRQFAREFRKFVLDHHYHISLEDWLKELGGENKQAAINIRDCAHIIEQNSNQSYEGGYKIYLLWMVERLRHDAAPKLLKTLEEPENKTLFILMAENSDKILSTILSRTQLVKVPCLSTDMVKQQLVAEYGQPETRAREIAEICEGDYHKALSIMNETGERKWMMNLFDRFMQSAVAFAKHRPMREVNFHDTMNTLFDALKEGRETQKNFIAYMLSMLRYTFLIANGQPELVKTTREEMEVIAKLSPYITLKNITLITNEGNQALYHVERNGNSSLIFTDLYLKMARHLE